MLAMRAGQPCLVNAVGGLVDTVADDDTGFVFCGNSPAEAAAAMVARLQDALELFHDRPDRWQAMRSRAAAMRYTWDTAAQAYLVQLYDG